MAENPQKSIWSSSNDFSGAQTRFIFCFHTSFSLFAGERNPNNASFEWFADLKAEGLEQADHRFFYSNRMLSRQKHYSKKRKFSRALIAY